jgi:HK97 gp10 family phage protein
VVVVARIRGAKEHAERLRRLTGAGARKRIGQVLFVAGDAIAVDAAISITNGAVSGKGHVRSRPGEAPNADTHQLDRGIITVQVAPLHVQVQSNAPHSNDLEFGTSKMAERPFMRPAVAKNRDSVIDSVRAAVSQIVRQK